VDLLIRGGLVADGVTPDLRRADVGITDGSITFVADLGDQPVEAAVVIDASSRIVAPGFIDIHTHSDVILTRDPSGASKVLQGVTTEVTGNCSFSPAPVHPHRRALLADHLARLGDGLPEITWLDLAGYAGVVEAMQPALNVVPLVGHSALRIAAMDEPYGPARAEDVRRMKELLDEALDAGAWGLSTGLTHSPSSLGSAMEIQQLADTVADHGGLYATHARASAGQEFAAIVEAIEAGRATGARLQFSHLALNDPINWGRATDALALFEAASLGGLDVGFDVYPYDASSSSLVQYLPEWVQAGGTEGLRRNGTDPDWRARALRDMADGWYGGIPWLWDRFLLASVGDRRELEGLTLDRAAEVVGCEPAELVLDLCTTIGSEVMVVLFHRMEADMSAFLAHPLACVGSDGNALPMHGDGTPHPRSFGTFPRVLGRYVRDQSVLTLSEGIAKMTSRPARRLGLTDRGAVAPGLAADLVVLDPARVADTATFERPRSGPVGIDCTIVAGRVVARDGELTGARPGKVLLRG
jgi:N-acyl-D-aspartate/D-glutamate deacylase